MKFNKFSLEL